VKFYHVVDQVVGQLKKRGRVSYRALQLEFDLSDEHLDTLKEELISIQELAVDKDGKMLVWTGSPASSVSSQESERVQGPKSKVQSQDAELRTANSELSPVSYTPPHLAERIRAEQAALEARSGTNGERKTITALFADLKGSTALIEGLDPEEARAIIDPALQLMMDAVHQYDGYVAQALGDGIFALFGAPLAHEDHPQRALYAALRMQEAMRRYADTLRAKGYPPLLMRVGINTGEVVVRSIRKDDLHTDYVPVGHSTNLAARMEQLANPGSIVVSAHTHRLTDGYFAFKDLGPTQIKGVEEPLNIYEVLSLGPLRTRLQVSARRGLTRFVGRQSEMEQLQRALEHAKAGHGQIVGTMGEPGLGKSRLFYEFKLLSVTGCLVLEAYSVSHGKATAYLPVIELLKSYFDIQAQDDERKRREKVGGKVLMLDRSLEDTLPYLFALLGIEEQPSPLQQMDAQIRRRRTFEALKKLFLRESLNQPLILIFEDLHWIDGETQGFLDVLSESVASAKLLLLTNYRPEYRHEWGQKTYYTQLRLAPLGKAEAEEFLDELLGESFAPKVGAASGRSGGGTPPPLFALKQLILAKTEGTPFFMEEVVQELREQGVLVRAPHVGAYAHTPLPTVLQLPPTVQGILAARIDRLAPDEKALLQQLAVIGREFPLGLIRQVITQPEADLYRLLASLQRKEFLYEQPAFPEVEYIFKHALTQEVTYSTVLQERRKAQHEKIAQAIEALYHSKLEEHFSDLAHHYSRSGNAAKAVEYLSLAGQQAVRQSANAEAITHLTTALELLKTLQDTPERTQQEITLQVALGISLGINRGYAAPEVGAVYTRARELCRQIGETPQLSPVLQGLYRFYLLRAEHQTARELAEQTLRLARRAQDPALLLEAHMELGFSSYELGEFVPALEHLEQGIALHDSKKHQFHAFHYGIDPGERCRSFAARALWYLGYPDQALKRNQEALTLARESSDPFNLSVVLYFAAVLHQLRQDVHLTQERAEAVVTISSERGFAMFLAQGTTLHGWVLAEQGQGEEGIAQMRQGLAAQRATGGELGRPYYAALLAETYQKVGQAEEGLPVLAEALATVDKSGERRHEAELYRIKGELTLQQESQKSKVKAQKSKVLPNPQSQILNPSSQGEAEAYFLKAIDIAQKQQAKSLELRAVMSLARLWRQQDKQTEAHEMLSEIYNWFTEGFDTKDLQEAKAFLAELATA
jgi:predicted ATPase/class 3 adenylate cyclase